MRISEGGTNLTVRNQSCRMCIARTLIQLMESKNLEDITITELVKKANVSRVTFYKYYKSKQEVIEDYMYEMVSDYVEDTKKRTDIGKAHEFKRICHCLEFLKKYSSFIMTLVNANMYSVIIDAVNNYMDTYVTPVSQYSRYELYYYAGALCNIFIKWLESGMIEKPDEIAKMVNRHWA